MKIDLLGTPHSKERGYAEKLSRSLIQDLRVKKPVRSEMHDEKQTLGLRRKWLMERSARKLEWLWLHRRERTTRPDWRVGPSQQSRDVYSSTSSCSFKISLLKFIPYRASFIWLVANPTTSK